MDNYNNRIRNGCEMMLQCDIEDVTTIERQESVDVDPFAYGIEHLHRLQESLDNKRRKP